MNIISLFLAVSAGICISSGLKFLIIGFGLERKSRVHYYFSFMSILFGIYFLASIQLYELVSAQLYDDFLFIIKWVHFLFYLAMISQFLFISEYTESKINSVLIMVISLFTVISLSNLLLPIRWLFTEVTFLNNTVVLNLSVWYIIIFLFTIITYAVFTGYYTYNYYIKSKKQPATFLGIAEGIFLVSFICDFLLIQWNLVPYFIVGQIGLMIFVLIISLYQGYSIKHTEQELEKTALLVSEITKQSGEGITVANTDGKYIFTNRAFCEMTDYTEKEVLNMSIYNFINPDVKPLLFQQVKNQKQGIREIEILKKDGTRFLAEISGFPVLLNNKNYILGVVRDITNKRQQELRMEESAKIETIGRLAGGIAHDFNNILAGIMGYAQIIEISLEKDSELKEYINQIMKASNRGKHLINQILVYSRKNPAIQKPLFIGPVVREALDFLKASLPSTIEIKAHYSPECKPVLIDETRIHEIVVNLVTNAADAIADKGEIAITVTEEQIKRSIIGRHGIVNPGFYTVITVKDNGFGMNETTLNNLFQPFFTTKKTGTGMGLAVVYSIVHNSNGEILVESQREKGSTFQIFLPKTNQINKPEILHDEIIQRGSETILFIDDEKMLLESLSKILEHQGYTVHAYLDPQDAMEFFRKESSHIDLIITDQTMPQTTGFELSKKFFRIKKDIPIILITGYSKDITKQMVLNSGIKKFLKKPFDSKKLNETIREALN